MGGTEGGGQFYFLLAVLQARSSSKMLGPAFGRTDFLRIFIFEPPDFVADFLAGFFLIFVGKSAQKNPPGKCPGKSSKFYTTKILQHISADWQGQKMIFFDLKTCTPVQSTPRSTACMILDLQCRCRFAGGIWAANLLAQNSTWTPLQMQTCIAK